MSARAGRPQKVVGEGGGGLCVCVSLYKYQVLGLALG